MTPGPAELDDVPRTALDDELERILASGAVRSLYQPIVDLATGEHVGVEALARGPAGSALERPDALFDRARAVGRLADLDHACRAAAISGAAAAHLAAPWTLFVNTEPETTTAASFGRSAPGRADTGPRVVVEFTERALTRDPAELLRTVARVRELGYGVAVDDVGADPASLALLPLIQPDVVKLDLRLVQRRPSADITATVVAVNAEAERSGAIVLAEGIETPHHLRTALAFGATLGQGWLFGRPGPLPPRARPPARGLELPGRLPALDTPSPFALAAGVRSVRSADKALLIEMSKHLERQAAASGECAVVVSTFQEARFFTPRTRRRYRVLAEAAAFVGVLGRGLPPAPLDGVRGGDLDAGDPLHEEWDVAVVSPHFAAALVARDLGDAGPDADRRFDFVLTYDRDLVVDVAACLLSRIAAA